MESLCRPAIHLRKSAQRALGSLWPSRSAAKIWHVGIPDRLVVGRRQSRQGGIKTFMTRGIGPGSRPDGAGISRRSVIRSGASTLSAAGFGLPSALSASSEETETHGLSAFGDL